MPDQPEHCPQRKERFARIKRVKQLLRYMPRRAVLHKYPLVGRFADAARRRAFLWSFKPVHMRPALYAGSILSLLPVMGVQLPIALLLSFLLRANFMVLGGLQFLTNPVTAAPIYYATHQLGAYVISVAGFGESLPAVDASEAVLPFEDDAPVAAPVAKATWVGRIGTAFNALIVGGTLSGIALAVLLDILYRNYWQHYTLTHPRRPPPTPPPEPEPPAAPPA